MDLSALNRLKTLPPSSAARFLLVFNTVTAIFGLVFMAVAFFTKNQARKEASWADMVTNRMSMLGIAAGLLTLFMSMFGCFTTMFRSRKVLLCYLIVFLIVWIIQVAATAGVGSFSSLLKMKDASLPSGALTYSVDIQIQNAAFSAYQRCCTGCPPDNTTMTNVCNNNYDDSWVPYVLPNCQSATIQCQFVTLCNSTTQPKCFKFLPGDDVVIPAYYVDSSTCDMLSRAPTISPQGKKIYVVGSVDTGACGGGDPLVFLKELDIFLSRNLAGMSIAFGVIVFFEAVMVLPAVFYLYHVRDSHWAIDSQVGMGENGAGAHVVDSDEPMGVAMGQYYSGFSGGGGGGGGGGLGKGEEIETT